MKLPTINEIKTQTSTTAEFKGLNKTEMCAENEFNIAYNVTADKYPASTTRSLRRKVSSADKVLGLIGGDKLYIVYKGKIRIVDGNSAHDVPLSVNLSDEKKKLVRMGSRLVIFPDKKIFDTETETMSNIEISYYNENAVFTLTNAYGDAITYHDDAYYAEHDPKSGDYLLVNEDGNDVLKQYNETEDVWVDITTSYVMVTAVGIGTTFKAGVGVKFEVDCSNWEEGKTLFPNKEGNLNTATYVIKSVSENAITFAGILKHSKTINGAFRVKRECPNIAYATEHYNRIWGCNKEGTEIYACALGDATSWNTFEGISTDSYVATIGSEGAFTGAITYLGYPTFFKKDSLIKVSVSANGAHVLKEVFCRGVAEGCSESLCTVNEVLHYKSTDAIMYYDGSLPTKLSDKLGDLTNFKNVVAGSHKGKLYMCGTTGCYVYDSTYGMWTETDDSFDMFTQYGEYFVYAKDKLLTLSDYIPNIVSMSETNSDIHWELRTRDIDYYTPNSKYIQRIVMKLRLNSGSSVKVSIKYDDGVYENVLRYQQRGTSIIPIALTMRRCNRFSLKVEGIGEGTIYSITKTLAEGSDKY